MYDQVGKAGQTHARLFPAPGAKSVADRFLPTFDFTERHSTVVHAPPDTVRACVQRLDLSGSRVVRVLFRLRGMPRSSLRLDGLERMGFRRLTEPDATDVALGLIGRFWQVGGGICHVDASDFASFDEPGWAKAVWSFQLTPIDTDRTKLATETRVRCTDVHSRRRFRMYWLFVRPFSGLIRRIALREIRRQAEAARGSL